LLVNSRIKDLLPRVLAVTAPLAVGAAVACTAFNDATVAATKTGGDSGMPPPPPPGDGALADAQNEASSLHAYLSTQDAAKLCTWVFACPTLAPSILESIDVPIDGSNYSLCMEWAAGPIPPDREGFDIQQQTLACIARATDCKTAGACAVLESLGPGDPRCPVPPGLGNDSGSYCTDDGGTAIECPGYAEHCGASMYAPGSSCHYGNDGLATCTPGDLDAGCGAAATCQASYMDYCARDGLHFTLNCATVGGLCGFTDAGIINCGPACTVVTTMCAGAAVQVCDGLEDTIFDCAAEDASCNSMGSAFYCKLGAAACSPTDPDVNVCSGTSISLCVGGQKSSFDCASIGKGCVAGTAPATAHCG
jgi:hypothetical protein